MEKNITTRYILDYAETAFSEGQFEAFFQPQYSTSTGLLTGAEALARWRHPEFGVLSPFYFVTLFEENDLISKLDYVMFEDTCKFLRKLLDEGVHTVPISVNLSRNDIYTEGYLQKLDECRKKYDIPIELVRIEVTESIAMAGKERAQAAIEQMHSLGYLVELDDFGSGYSSLNVLKDVDYDIIKLDMAFLSNDVKGKGGTIISSMVRMAKWLKMPVIAEGVETKDQADFLKSIGCDYIQGYYYSKPISAGEFFAKLENAEISAGDASIKFKKTVNPTSFWDDKSIETLIFSNYVGGAAVFSYDAEGSLEYLRVNQKYIMELGMNMTEDQIVRADVWSTMKEENDKAIFRDALRRAIESEEEQECETWRTIESTCCGAEDLCIRSNIILIGKSENEYIFYEMIRNITAEKKQYAEGLAFERGFRNITEQANIYYWEYTVQTKEMRPCFRCMRDLGLPPLVTNYPEPAIAQGIFPPDYADMYRDWHRQIADGVDHLEAIIPLTVGRVPFHVRYTTEFDELGRPVKAYGSATLVTPEEAGENK